MHGCTNGTNRVAEGGVYRSGTLETCDGAQYRDIALLQRSRISRAESVYALTFLAAGSSSCSAGLRLTSISSESALHGFNLWSCKVLIFTKLGIGSLNWG